MRIDASPTCSPPRLILGSSSAYRRELLSRLLIPFEIARPEIDETPRAAESPIELAARLAEEKADAVARTFTDDVVVIGADQVADLGGRPLGKPGNHAGAVEQLRLMSGQLVKFHSAQTVCRPRTNFKATRINTVTVRFRALSAPEIERYLQLEQPYDCAGSAKVEGLGITLLEEVQSNDPTSLIGLPLIDLCAMLREAGLDPLRPLPAP